MAHLLVNYLQELFPSLSKDDIMGHIRIVTNNDSDLNENTIQLIIDNILVEDFARNQPDSGYEFEPFHNFEPTSCWSKSKQFSKQLQLNKNDDSNINHLQSLPLTQKNIASDSDLLPFVLSFFLQPPNPALSAEDYRQKALNIWTERSALHRKASEAFQKYKYTSSQPVAGHYASEASALTQELDNYNSMAAYITIKDQNSYIIDSLDCHGLRCVELLKFLYPLLFAYFHINLEEHVNSISSPLGKETKYIEKCKPFRFIIGMGFHSSVKSRLRPTLINALRSNPHKLNWHFVEQQGCILIKGWSYKK